jgi:hypothetical protein
MGQGKRVKKIFESKLQVSRRGGRPILGWLEDVGRSTIVEG